MEVNISHAASVNQSNDDVIRMSSTSQSRGFDFSQWNFPFALWLIRPQWECALKIGFFLPVIIVSVLGNGFVLYLMATNRFLRTSINIFIWNLATADLLTILLFSWIILVIDLHQMFVLGAAICEMEGFLRVMLMLVDVLSLIAISYDRFMSIAFPFRPKMGHVTAYIIAGIIWIVAVSIAVPLVTARTYKERQWKNVLESWCVDDVRFDRVYYFTLNAILFWFPFIIMTVLFTWMFIKLKQRTSTCTAVQLKQLAQRRKVVVMLSVILISFIICYTPFTVFTVIRNDILTGEFNSVPEWLRSLLYVSRFLTCVNTAINPIIYGFGNDNFRKAAARQFPRFKWGLGPVAGSRPLTESPQPTHTTASNAKVPAVLNSEASNFTDVSSHI